MRIKWCCLDLAARGDYDLSKHHFGGQVGMESRLGVGSRMSMMFHHIERTKLDNTVNQCKWGKDAWEQESEGGVGWRRTGQEWSRQERDGLQNRNCPRKDRGLSPSWLGFALSLSEGDTPSSSNSSEHEQPIKSLNSSHDLWSSLLVNHPPSWACHHRSFSRLHLSRHGLACSLIKEDCHDFSDSVYVWNLLCPSTYYITNPSWTFATWPIFVNQASPFSPSLGGCLILSLRGMWYNTKFAKFFGKKVWVLRYRKALSALNMLPWSLSGHPFSSEFFLVNMNMVSQDNCYFSTGTTYGFNALKVSLNHEIRIET